MFISAAASSSAARAERASGSSAMTPSVRARCAAVATSLASVSSRPSVSCATAIRPSAESVATRCASRRAMSPRRSMARRACGPRSPCTCPTCPVETWRVSRSMRLRSRAWSGAMPAMVARIDIA
jgi:hypothetical protein